MDGWAGIDPYRPDYEKLRSLRRSVELMLQLESAVDDFLGEMLFPICTYRYPLDSSLELLELVPDSDVFLTRSLFDVPQKQASSSAKAVHLKKLSDAIAPPQSSGTKRTPSTRSCLSIRNPEVSRRCVLRASG